MPRHEQNLWSAENDETVHNMNRAPADVPPPGAVTTSAEPPVPILRRLFTWRTRIYGTPPEIVARWPVGVACAVMSAIVAADALFVDKPDFTTLDSLLVLVAGVVTAVIVYKRATSPAGLQVDLTNFEGQADRISLRHEFKGVALDRSRPLRIERDSAWTQLVGESPDGTPVHLVRHRTGRTHPYFNDGVYELCQTLGMQSPIPDDQLFQLKPLNQPRVEAQIPRLRPVGTIAFFGAFVILLTLWPKLVRVLEETLYDGRVLNFSANLATSMIPLLFMSTFVFAAVRILGADVPNYQYALRPIRQPYRVEIHHLPKRSLVYLRVAGSMYPTMVPGLHAHRRSGMTDVDRRAFEVRVGQYCAVSNLDPPVIAKPGVEA